MGNSSEAEAKQEFEVALSNQTQQLQSSGFFWEESQRFFLEQRLENDKITMEFSDFMLNFKELLPQIENLKECRVERLPKFNKLQAYREYLLSLTPRFVEETRLMDSILQHMGMKGTVEEIIKHFDQKEVLRIWQTLTKLHEQKLNHYPDSQQYVLFTKSLATINSTIKHSDMYWWSAGNHDFLSERYPLSSIIAILLIYRPHTLHLSPNSNNLKLLDVLLELVTHKVFVVHSLD